MKIDRMLFGRFSRPIRNDKELEEAVNAQQWEKAIQIMRERYADKPEEFVTIEKLMRAENLDRRLTWKEVLMRIFGQIERFKTRDELLEEEFRKFVAINKPEAEQVLRLKNFLHAYLTDAEIRAIIDRKSYSDLAGNPKLSLADLQALGRKWIEGVPAYIKDYISLNTYTP